MMYTPDDLRDSDDTPSDTSPNDPPLEIIEDQDQTSLQSSPYQVNIRSLSQYSSLACGILRTDEGMKKGRT